MKKTYLYVIILIVVVLGLFYLSWWLDPTNKIKAVWAQNGVECNLMEGEKEHFHPHLDITVDGEAEIVPANIGITGHCFAEIHTHDDSGIIHIESPYADKVFHLEQFFTVWGKSIERDGYTLTATVDGKPLPDPGKLMLADKQQIVFAYISVPKAQ